MPPNFISVDAEDWHTSAYLRHYVNSAHPQSVINASMEPILAMFQRKKIQATFFVLGSVAQENPDLIRKIDAAGHELASHGYSHTPLWNLTPDQFRTEIKNTNEILHDITRKKIKGFRAPYASLEPKTAWALDILEEEGFKYDSSIFPMRTPLYGVAGAPKGIYRISSATIFRDDPEAKLIEVPFTIWQSGPIKIPCTGGIYGRFLPRAVLRFLLKEVSKKRPVNFYFHPWETDRNIPKIKAPLYNKMVSYYNVDNYLSSIDAILDSMPFTSFENYFSSEAARNSGKVLYKE